MGYVRDFVPAMLAYCVVLVLVLTFGDLDGSSPWRFRLGGPAGGAVDLGRRRGGPAPARLDDYQQRLTLQSLGVGFAVAMAAAVTLGLLGAAGLQLLVTPWIIFGAGMAGWGITSIVVARRA